MQEVLPDDLEVTFFRRGVHYSMRISIRDTSTFNILLINDEIPERWESDFTAAFIQEITSKVGSTKRFAVFVKMIQMAVTGATEEVTFDVMTPNEIVRGKNVRTTDDKMYFIVNHVTQFDNVHYPLPLKINPFSVEELKIIIRKYRKENVRLRNELAESHNRDRIDSLESQVHEINETLTEMVPRRSGRRRSSSVQRGSVRSSSSLSYRSYGSARTEPRQPARTPRMRQAVVRAETVQSRPKFAKTPRPIRRTSEYDEEIDKLREFVKKKYDFS